MLKTKNSENTAVIGSMAEILFSFAGGFVLSGGSVAGIPSFAGVSLAGAVSLPQAVSVLVGSIIRYIAEGSIHTCIVQVFSLIMIVLYKLFFESPGEYADSIVTLITVLSSGVAVSALMGELTHKLLLCLLYSILSAVSALCFSKAIASVVSERAVDLRESGAVAFSVAYTIVISALCGNEFFVINPGIIAGAFVTLTGAYCFGCTGGAICGALSMSGAFLASASYGVSALFMPVAGILAGCTAKHHKAFPAVVFFAVSLSFSILLAVEELIYAGATDVMSGIILFIIFSPLNYNEFIKTADGSAELRRTIRRSLDFLVKSLGNVRNESSKISEMLSRKSTVQSDFTAEAKEVCSHCHKRLGCWYNNQATTKNGFRKLSQLSEVTEESFPCELSDCLRKEELARFFEKKALEKATEKIIKMKQEDSRRLLFEQMKITEEIIMQTGSNIQNKSNGRVADAVRKKLVKSGYNPSGVTAFCNEGGRLVIELYFNEQECPENTAKICEMLSVMLNTELVYSEPVRCGEEARIRLCRRTEYEIEAYGASICGTSEKQTGDSSVIFSDGTGISYIVISDGMGSGKEALLQSRMVTSMFRRLVSGSVDSISALKLINSIMMTKSDEESFATFDAVKVDLDSCELTLIKAGASATLIRHKGQVLKVASTAFPIGITDDPEIFVHNYDFEQGDILIMFSDGISESEYQFIKELLLGSDDLRYIVSEICNKAGLFNRLPRTDDITVIGARLLSNNI